MAAIVKEIRMEDNFISDQNVGTIYIGGGTPSLLSCAELRFIFDALRERFVIANDAEITLEANPDDINPLLLNEWLKLGINRLSVGLQSFNEAELKWMNRAHNAGQSIQCLKDISAAGFVNYSVDLIYGSPLQSNDDLKRNFEIISQRNVPHISCYALTVETGTALNRSIENKKGLHIDADKQAEQFYLLLDLMAEEEYEQYEISNFAKPGFCSRHNSSYWEGKPYYGFGPAAHAFNGYDKRRWNISNNSLYLQSMKKNIIPYEEEILTETHRLNEYVMIALRIIEGINIEYVRLKFGEANAQRIASIARKFIGSGKISINETSVTLTEKGKFFADGIAAELFG